MKKILSILLVLSIFFSSARPVFAVDAPVAPTAPTAPVPETAPTAPQAPSSSSVDTPKPTSAPEKPNRHNSDSSSNDEIKNDSTFVPSPVTTQSNPSPTTTPASGAGAVGNREISTGDATNSVVSTTSGNANASVVPEGSTSSDTQIINSGNGAYSNNTGIVDVSGQNNTDQNNNANVDNTLNQSANTGNNNASYGVGNSLVKTGDANVSGTVINSVNTNIDGVAVAEFNIADNHQGDYVLDFNQNCISGCGGNSSAKNSQNGAGSSNSNTLIADQTNETFQNNDANVGNQLILSADSGNNQTSFNTGGDSAISTGDANVSANSLTFANNNISGNVVYGVVNIYGDLHGDIIFPEEALNNCCGSNIASSNIGNGADSSNTNFIANGSSSSTNQQNNATIENELVLDANTGNNTINGNTGGDNLAMTGNANVTAQAVNVANTNVDGGTVWLVLVNQAGNWVGQIMGAPVGTNYAGSEGMGLNVDSSGTITASNNGNGANSENNNTVNANNISSLDQENNATVKNSLNLSANTGNNDASYNTGGVSAVQTGDANIVANMVNFVNNNIAAGGKLVVTVVNVFGSWVGDFVTPGHEKTNQNPSSSTAAIGGADVSTSTSTQQTSSNNVQQTSITTNPATSTTTSQKKKSPSKAIPQVLAAASESKIVVDAKNAKSSVVYSSNTPKTVNINLAWLLVLLPGLLVPVVIKLRKAKV